MTSEAAALTEQERDYLALHGVNLHTPPCEQCPEAQAAIEHVLAARLADSRPVVSEAAIQAASDVIAVGIDTAHGNGVQIADALICDDIARAALPAALPHMGDGKGEADLRDRINALADEWDAAARDFTDQAEGMSGDRAAKHYAVASKYALHAQRVRALLDPLRLSPTGDETP